MFTSATRLNKLYVFLNVFKLVENDLINLYLNRLKKSDFRLRDVNVFIGAHDITQREETKRVYRIKQIHIHPNMGTKNVQDFDFAILELSGPTGNFDQDFQPQLYRPICLPRASMKFRVGAELMVNCSSLI